MIDTEIKGIQSLQKSLIDLQQFFKKGSKKIMDVAGQEAINIIIKRTKSGYDVKRQKFKGYSPAYAKKKGSSRVNLDDTGKMLDGIKKQVKPKIVRIYMDTTGRGNINNYNLMAVHNLGLRSGRGKGFKMPEREFFGLSEKEYNDIFLLINKLIDKEIDRLYKR